MNISKKHKSDDELNAEIIAAIRLIAPRHTAKWVARKWNKALVTAKLWLSQGIPASKLPAILEDLDQELEQLEQELTEQLAARRAALQRGLHEAFEDVTGNGGRRDRGLSGAAPVAGDALDGAAAPGNFPGRRGA